MDKNETVLDAARNLMWSRAPLSIGRKSFADADRLDAITHLRAALLVIEGHIDVARNDA